jgi:hypothetical protein
MFFPEISQRSSSAAIDHHLPFSCKHANNIEGYDRYFVGVNHINLKSEGDPYKKSTKPKNLFSQQSCSRRSHNKMDLNSKWISLHEEKGIINKKFYLKNNQKKFPNDFFENMMAPERKAIELNGGFNLNQLDVRSSVKNFAMLKKNNSEFSNLVLSPSIANLPKNVEGRSQNLEILVSNRKREKMNLQINNQNYNNLNKYDFNEEKIMKLNRYNDSFDEYTSFAQNKKPKSSFAKVGRLTPLRVENNSENFIMITQEQEKETENEFIDKTLTRSILEIEDDTNPNLKANDKLFTFYNNNCQISEGEKERNDSKINNESKIDPNMTSTFSKKNQIMVNK